MRASQLYFVSGKGGVGKTVIATALAKHAAARGKRVLLVDPSGRGGISSLFGGRPLCADPIPLVRRIDGVRLEPRALLEGYFTRLLRVPLLSRILFESNTFNALTAATPGVSEFLTLESLLRWTGNGSSKRRPRYDLVVVDGPATGHALRLFRAPRQFAAMVPGGPIGSTAARLVEMLSDHEHTHILLVTIPDEMAVNETIEACEALGRDPVLNLTRPVLNRVAAKRFTRSEEDLVVQLSRARNSDPLLAAARVQIGVRNDARRHLDRLNRAFGRLPVTVSQFSGNGPDTRKLLQIGSMVGRAVLGGT